MKDVKMTLEKQGSIYCPLKDLMPLLRCLPTELQNMLPGIGKTEWHGQGPMLRYSVISGAGGKENTKTLRLDIPISGTQPVEYSSSSPTKPGEQAKTTAPKTFKLGEMQLKNLLKGATDPTYE